MTSLWALLPGIQASVSRCAARHRGALADRCSASRVRFAAANSAAPLTPPRRSAEPSICDGRLRREPEANQFLRLTETRTDGRRQTS